MNRMSARLLVLAMCASTAVACGGSSDGTSKPGSLEVSSSTIDGWPLTVDSGTLRCEGSGGTGAVTIEASGTVYALNGVAKGQHKYADIAPIWADNPMTAGLKKDIGVLIDAGLKLCK